MLQHAEQLGANAVVGQRYDASDVVGQSTEAFRYGKAVRIEPA